MQDPEIYLTELDVSFRCVMVEGQDAVLDPAHKSYVNHEVFFFSALEQKEAFDRQPQLYCGLVTDPVSRSQFTPSELSPRQDYMERPYFFESDSTLALFAASPDSFAIPRLRMTPETDEGE